VGYGDITPLNPVETALVLLVLFLFALMYGFFLTNLWNAFGQYFAIDACPE
jgi:hypothetical protein